MFSINELALNVFEEMADFHEELNIEVMEQENGVKVIDAGVKAEGGFEAGIYLSRLCMSDLADIKITAFDLNSVKIPAVGVVTDHPVVACMASQYAGWRVKGDNFFGMGSGPGRIYARKPPELYDKIDYEDESDVAVLVLEASSMPDTKVTGKIADACGIETENLFIAVAPTSSVAGSVQVSARIVETGIHKMESLGFDINCIKSGSGIAPIAPVVGDDARCMGSTNDCLIYCGSAYYAVKYDNLDELVDYVKKIPSCCSSDYGQPFYVTFKNADFDFFKIDAGMFAPAQVTMNELGTGRVFTAGSLNPDVLMESFGMQKIE